MGLPSGKNNGERWEGMVCSQRMDIVEGGNDRDATGATTVCVIPIGFKKVVDDVKVVVIVLMVNWINWSRSSFSFYLFYFYWI
jgi:hypothetical protein